MNYKAVLSERAEQQLLKFPRRLQCYILFQISLLEKTPVSLSRPSRVPEPPGKQIYEFHHEYDGLFYVFRILFLYDQDERTLHIMLIGHTASLPPYT